MGPHRRDLSIVSRLVSLAAVAAVALPACGNGIARPASHPAVRTAASPSAASTLIPDSGAGVDPRSLSGNIVFSAGAPHHEDVFISNADGTGVRRLTTDPQADFDPELSPDGTRIVFRHEVDGNYHQAEIYVMNVEGTGVRNLTNNDIADWGPSWSPDSKHIVFDSDRDTVGSDLHGFVMNADGTDVRPLGDYWVEYPAWSPDGSRIAFMSQTWEDGDDYEIFVVNADGTGLTRLTDSPGPDGWPAWSPDGSKIAFASTRDDCQFSQATDCSTTGDLGPFHDIYVMNADGSGQHRLSQAFGQFPTWSPDGRYILFAPHLNVMLADGGTEVHLTEPGLGSEAEFPDWPTAG